MRHTKKILTMKYKVQVWFRWCANGQEEKDFQIQEVEAENESQAKRKALDECVDIKAIPYKTEII